MARRNTVKFKEEGHDGKPEAVYPRENSDANSDYFNALARGVALNFKDYLATEGRKYLVEPNIVIGKLTWEMVPGELSEKSPIARCNGAHYHVREISGRVVIRQLRKGSGLREMLEGFVDSNPKYIF